MGVRRQTGKKSPGQLPNMGVPVVNDTYPEVVIHVAAEDGFVIIGSLQIGRFVIRVFSKLLLEPLLVVHHNLLAFSLQEADESLDDSQGAASDRDQNQDLTY